MADSDLPGKREAFIERLLESVRGTFDIFSAYIGARLGLYESLAEAGPSTSAELASQTGTHERYTREWLEQQAVTGILDVDDEKSAASARRFRLPEAHAEVLVDRESLNYLAPLPQLLVGAVSPISQSQVLDAYRKGGGVPYADYGADLVKGQEGINRTMFLQELGKVWLPAIADVHQRLGSDPSARVADVGCGAGWSAIGIAQSYPQVQVDGSDLDEASVEIARANAREAGLSDRVRFHVRDAADPQLAGRYDLVTAFECIHDMSRPVGGLEAMRSLAGDDGTVLDERVGEEFSTKEAEVDRMMYGWTMPTSKVWCSSSWLRLSSPWWSTSVGPMRGSG